jgi:hypothetical protein
MDSDGPVTDLSVFRLVRAYALGRNRAHELSTLDRAQVDLCGAEVLNPYATEPERSRWSEGFTEAWRDHSRADQA